MNFNFRFLLLITISVAILLTPLDVMARQDSNSNKKSLPTANTIRSPSVDVKNIPARLASILQRLCQTT